MILHNVIRNIYFRKVHCINRYYASSALTAESKIRNIGILAHIDAGKCVAYNFLNSQSFLIGFIWQL